MKTQYILLSLLALALTGVGLAYFLRAGKNEKNGGPESENGAGSSGSVSSGYLDVVPGCTRVLQMGSTGEPVKILQQYLNRKLTGPFLSLKVDGIFGPKTAAVLNAIEGTSSITLKRLNLC